MYQIILAVKLFGIQVQTQLKQTQMVLLTILIVLLTIIMQLMGATFIQVQFQQPVLEDILIVYAGLKNLKQPQIRS